MYIKKYLFYETAQKSPGSNDEAICLTSKDLYDEEKGYGFITEANRMQLESLQIPELNSGFEPYYWLKGQSLLQLIDTPGGVALLEGSTLPLLFKTAVPKQGNYQVSITITAKEKPIHEVFIFIGCRRLIARRQIIKEGESFLVQATINICDIIPRGKTSGYPNTSFNLAILADNPTISELRIEEADCPTIFIAGDSTLTDQNCSYPYNPGTSYCGWAQMLPYYFNQRIAISNHSHSGLTTETFRSEGHHNILKNNCKPGDYFFIQFGHNDQKLPHLSANGGYANRIREYVKEMKELGVHPVLITSLARNTWKGDGGYNDLLKDYAESIIAIGSQLNIPVLDLHQRSMEFILQEGVEAAERYYYPGDYTHSNDYGGFLMAGYVVQDCLKQQLLKEYIKPDYQDYCNTGNSDNPILSTAYSDYRWLPPQEIVLPKPPVDYVDITAAIYTSNFTDLEESSAKETITKLAELGILSNTEDLFRPKDTIKRIELLDWIIKGVRFVPTNVYNDRYEDVIGHEWYAGTVEAVCQNEIVNPALTVDGHFHPMADVTAEQLVSFCMVSYRCRKTIPHRNETYTISGSSSWASKDLAIASNLGFIDSSFHPDHLITREEAAVYIKKLIDLL